MAKKKKIEFKKLLAVFAVLLILPSLVASYFLAFMGMDTVETLTGIVITTCFAYLVTYATTSAFEKHSRNKYQIDENGVPFNQASTAEDTPEDSKTIVGG